MKIAAGLGAMLFDRSVDLFFGYATLLADRIANRSNVLSQLFFPTILFM